MIETVAALGKSLAEHLHLTDAVKLHYVPQGPEGIW